jgi:hypothetical protein
MTFPTEWTNKIHVPKHQPVYNQININQQGNVIAAAQVHHFSMIPFPTTAFMRSASQVMRQEAYTRPSASR